MLVDTIPMVPDRLSYSEMAIHEFKYPSIWTKDFDRYKKYKDQLVARIVDYMENYDDYRKPLEKQKLVLSRTFFSGNELYKAVK